MGRTVKKEGPAAGGRRGKATPATASASGKAPPPPPARQLSINDFFTKPTLYTAIGAGAGAGRGARGRGAGQHRPQRRRSLQLKRTKSGGGERGRDGAATHSKRGAALAKQSASGSTAATTAVASTAALHNPRSTKAPPVPGRTASKKNKKQLFAGAPGSPLQPQTNTMETDPAAALSLTSARAIAWGRALPRAPSSKRLYSSYAAVQASPSPPQAQARASPRSSPLDARSQGHRSSPGHIASPLRQKARGGGSSQEAGSPLPSQTFSCGGDDLIGGMDLDAILNHVRPATPSKSPLASQQKQQQQPVATPPMQRGPSLLVELVDEWDMSDELPLSEICTPVPGRAVAPPRRFAVVQVDLTMFNRGGAKPNCQQLELQLQDEAAKETAMCILRDEWVYTRVQAGDHVMVHGRFDEHQVCIVSCTENLLVVNPDVLVSGTRLTESFTCQRKAVLSSRYRSEQAFCLTRGTILHELLQRALGDDNFETDYLHEHIEDLIQEYLLDLLVTGQTVVDLRRELLQFVPSLQLWADQFLRGTRGQGVVFRHMEPGKGDEQVRVAMTSLLDIEETYWCPRFGIKGIVDVSMEVKIHERGKPHASSTQTMPFEIKSGKPVEHGSVAHRAQVILYALMMGDRYGKTVDRGLLHYMKSGDMYGIPFSHSDVKGLIMARNDLAQFMAQSSREKLPEMMRAASLCKRCSYLDTCTTLHHSLEAGSASTSGLGTLFTEKTTHLTPQDSAFLALWEELIDLEASCETAASKIWLPPSAGDDGKKSASLGGLVFDSQAKRGSHHVCRFLLPEATRDQESQDLPVSESDSVVLSTDDHGLLAFASATVLELGGGAVVVKLQRESKLLSRLQREGSSHPFRIDVDVSRYSNKTARSNLVRLFDAPCQANGNGFLRHAIVGLEPPRFKALSGRDTDAVEACLVGAELNADQKAAIRLALTACDYTLIQGMPGTGKTTTIAVLVEVLVKVLRQSVLLSSFTHSAVDNILLKLQGKVECLRLGSVEKIRPELHGMTPNIAADADMPTIKQVYDGTPVVATTCLGASHKLFRHRKFDVCIVDEASQITQVVCLGPLHAARKFVLVGDHLQLPPLVRNATARDKGMDISLFKRLSEAHPEAVAKLQFQYRMNQSIMRLANSCVYDNKLQCGTQGVATQTLDLAPPPALLEQLQGGAHSWLAQTLDPAQSVLFFDTDEVPGRESKNDENVLENKVEARLVAAAVTALVLSGCPAEQIGVISPYRHQLKVLKAEMQAPALGGIEMNTVDKYQGRDKDCIVISLVRSNADRLIGRLLQDWRRINVALTRARSKLLIFGSASTVQTSPILEQVLQVTRQEGGYCVLPSKADVGCQAVLRSLNPAS